MIFINQSNCMDDEQKILRKMFKTKHNDQHNIQDEIHWF